MNLTSIVGGRHREISQLIEAYPVATFVIGLVVLISFLNYRFNIDKPTPENWKIYGFSVGAILAGMAVGAEVANWALR